MNRWMAMTAGAMVLALVPGGVAWADSVTVQGTSATGDPTTIDKMVVNNRQGSVLLKIFGTGGKDNVDEVVAYLKDGDGTKYQAVAGWYPGGVWATSLSRGDNLVECDDFSFKWNADGEFWKVLVPRDCLDNLANRIKGKSELASPLNATPGYTPWSAWVKRG